MPRLLPALALLAAMGCASSSSTPDDGGSPATGRIDGSPCDAGSECLNGACVVHACQGGSCAFDDGGVDATACAPHTHCRTHPPGCDVLYGCFGWSGTCATECGFCPAGTSCANGDVSCADDSEWNRFLVEIVDAEYIASNRYYPGTQEFEAGVDHLPDGVTAQQFAWDFGDGATGSGQSTSHVFAHAGTYTVKLEATSSDGQTATAQLTDQVICLADGGNCFDGVCCAGLSCFHDVCTPPDRACSGDGGDCFFDACCAGLHCQYSSCVP